VNDQPRRVKRPPPWQRIVAASVLLTIVGQLIFQAQRPISLAAGLVASVLLLIPIVAPSFIYDERTDGWLQRHQIIETLLLVVIVGTFVFFLIKT
jgi:hypothetical protein